MARSTPTPIGELAVDSSVPDCGTESRSSSIVRRPRAYLSCTYIVEYERRPRWDIVLILASIGGAVLNIKNGVAPDFNMVPFKDQLKDEEIFNVVNYACSIAKKK